MYLSYEGRLEDFSRELRQHMTDAEKALWTSLRGRQLKGCRFYRQRVVGDTIVDFYCPEARLVIEIEGELPDREDLSRDRALRERGLEILRFSERDVLVEKGRVVERISGHLRGC